MLGPLVSETFVNHATIGNASFTATSVTTSSSDGPVTISYNAANQRYTLSSATGTVFFGPSDIDPAQSSAGAVVYVKTSGSTTDTLTLTRPGTSGPLTYTYVGSAFWQRTNVSSSTTGNGSINAVVYGVPTSDAGVPHTGQAIFVVDLLGARTVSDNVIALAGNGTTFVDFSTGVIATSGRLTQGIQGGTPNATFSSIAQLASNGNSFTGDITLDDFGTFRGTLNGRFYGPDASEIGAAFRATYAGAGEIAVGTIMGRRGAAPSANTQFNDTLLNPNQPVLNNAQAFSTDAATIGITLAGSSGGNTGDEAFSNGSSTTGGLVVIYDPATRSYTLVASDRSQTFFPSNYSINLGTGSETLSTSAAKTYLRVSSWDYRDGSAGNSTRYRLSNFVYGFATPDSAVPRTGSASYDLDVSGTIADTAAPNFISVGGTGVLNANFGTGALRGSGALQYRENNDLSGYPRLTAAGDFDLTAQIASDANRIDGTISMTGIGSYSGPLSGRFYGPAAQELGGTFTIGNGAGGIGAGTFTGLLDPDSLPPPPGSLETLTAPTAFVVKRDDRASPEGTISAITYDPADKSYAISFDTGGLTLTAGPGSIMEPSPSLGFHNYSGVINNPNGTITEWIGLLDNLDATTPLVELSYMNFGRIFTADRLVADRTGWDYHLFAGGIAATNMPTTGTASYTGASTGFASVYHNGTTSDYSIYAFFATLGLAAHFANGTITGTFSDMSGDLFRSENVPGNALNRIFPGFTLNGTISGTNFTGSAVQGDWQRSMDGAFFGPGAAEAGGTFSANMGNFATSPEAIEIDGSFGAGKN